MPTTLSPSLQTILLVTALPMALLAEPPGSFTVEKAEGKSCEIQPLKKEWQTAKPGEKHPLGSVGKTGTLSTLTISFDSQNRFRILPKGEVTISPNTREAKFRKVGGDKTDVLLGLSKGKIEVEEKPKDYEIKVQTPTAVCGAVGTTFSVEVNGNDPRNNSFICMDGKIETASGEDNSFKASLKGGQSLKATVQPGKENSVARLESGNEGALDVTLASNTSHAVKPNSVIEIAQGMREDSAALRITQGSLDDKKAGRYLLDSKGPVSVTSKNGGEKKFDDFMDAARAETALRHKLTEGKSPSEIQQIIENNEELKQLAQEATRMRNDLFRIRDELRRPVRDGQRLDQHMPTPRF